MYQQFHHFLPMPPCPCLDLGLFLKALVQKHTVASWHFPYHIFLYKWFGLGFIRMFQMTLYFIIFKRGVLPGGWGPGKIFLPVLFRGATAKFPMRGITCLSVKQAGLEIPNPTLSAWYNYMAECVIIWYLVAALCKKTYFKPGDHAIILW